MGLDGLSNLIEGGHMTHEVPREEMTAKELAQQGKQPDDAQAAEADQVQRGHEAEVADPPEPNGDEDDPVDDPGSEPAPVDDPDIPEDGDPEVDDLEPEPIPDDAFEDPEPETSDTREQREEPADLSGVEKEFDD